MDGISTNENPATSESDDDEEGDGSGLDENDEILAMDRLERVPFDDEMGVDYGSDASM